MANNKLAIRKCGYLNFIISKGQNTFVVKIHLLDFYTMNTENNGEDRQNEARNLYFQTGLTQAQIADLIGVSQKTVSLWVNENKWSLIKQRASQAPAVFLEQMNSELQEMNEVIASRPSGQRFPTVQEAEIRRKIMTSIAGIKDRQSAGNNAEMLTNFLKYVAKKNLKDAQTLTRYADAYLKGEMKMSSTPQFQRYDLPGDLPATSSDGTPPAADGADINKAA
jgi:DNA-binding XRE family transcriptional regulator